MKANSGRAARVLACLIAAAPVGACAAVRHASVQKGDDLSSIIPGTTRGAVEKSFGSPQREWVTPVGVHYCLYRYVGDGPPAWGDAATLAALDVGTLGAWEVGIFLQEYFDPKARKVWDPDRRGSALFAVSYDQQDRVIGMFANSTELDDFPADGRPTITTRAAP
jgi:hypothetical protein